MRTLVARLFLVSACAALGATAPVGCVPGVQPGFVPAPAPPTGGPALVTTATLGDAGHADVTIAARELGAVFGVSFHLTASNATLDDAATSGTLALALNRVLARVDDGARNDAAFGGTRLDPADGDVAIDDGALASVHLTANEAGAIELHIERAVVRKADGSFVPVAVAGGTLTLEAAP